VALYRYPQSYNKHFASPRTWLPILSHSKFQPVHAPASIRPHLSLKYMSTTLGGCYEVYDEMPIPSDHAGGEGRPPMAGYQLDAGASDPCVHCGS